MCNKIVLASVLALACADLPVTVPLPGVVIAIDADGMMWYHAMGEWKEGNAVDFQTMQGAPVLLTAAWMSIKLSVRLGQRPLFRTTTVGFSAVTTSRSASSHVSNRSKAWYS